MTENHQKALKYLKEIHKHLGRLDYKDFCIDLNSFNINYPSIIEDKLEIERIEESYHRDKTIIYRARPNDLDINGISSNLPFKTVSEISIMPENKREKIKFGRCNKPNEPRFYSSNEPRTACIESLTQGFTKDLSESKYVTLGRWKIKEPLALARINYSAEWLNKFYRNDPEKYKFLVQYSYEFHKDTIKKISEIDEFNVDFAEQVLGLFSDEFAKTDIKEGHDYTISNFYCDNIFDLTSIDNKDNKIDGILYPSASFAYQEMNLVLHPRAMKKIQFIDAALMWIVHHHKDRQIEFIRLEQNVKADNEGNLQWKKFR